MRVIIWLFISYVIGVLIGFYCRIEHQKQQQCTDKCRVKELELQKEIEEYDWRKELINNIKNK